MAKGAATFDLEQAFYVLQKKEELTGEWTTQGNHVYRGRSDAQEVLKRIRAERPKELWRQLLKQEAERYREGWKDCQEYLSKLQSK